MNGKNSVNSLEVYVKDTQGRMRSRREPKKKLDSTFNNADNAYNVINMETIPSTMNTMEKCNDRHAGGYRIDKPLVGGIGIMNMMLVSVSGADERNRTSKSARGQSRHHPAAVPDGIHFSAVGGNHRHHH